MYLCSVKIEKIFVYGTLRKGGTAYHLMSSCMLLEEGITVSGFKLYDAGEYPFAFYTADPMDIITGDMFEIKEDILISLDEYEGEEYRKKVLPGFDCYIYILNKNNAPFLPVVSGGDWLLYKK
ncbi:gamma-glutamylcyclotransferase family protein ytfP [Sporocytophaga myxococcoides]|uniref:Gamma-glutamylcyclotransferase family protein ytfP n=1 Tax=Sporocytophaga myxococcoides TaxID=153721 RepID=A0A098LBD1_9BACT|nr:gamma-glutamylcyclotransferase family protein [Sporocytophaga myxococcoides]GAL83583.1 gamma-glutamylcyclotransferase family protein ytfP [Sporocytophaga myxococcoides]